MAFKYIFLACLLTIGTAKPSNLFNSYSSNFDHLYSSRGYDSSYLDTYNPYNSYNSPLSYSSPSVRSYSHSHSPISSFSSSYPSYFARNTVQPTVYDYSQQLHATRTQHPFIPNYNQQYQPEYNTFRNSYSSVAQEPTVSEYSTYTASAPTYSKTQVRSESPYVHGSYTNGFVHTPTIKTVAHEPTVSEYSTYVSSAPSYTKTEVKPQPPIVHASYSPAYLEKTVHENVTPFTASVKTVAHEPTVSEYSTYVATAPAYTKTEVRPQPDLIHESYTPGFVEKTVHDVAPLTASVKTIAHEPTVSEYSTYVATAPAFTKTDVHPQPDLVHESYTPGFVHKSVEAAPVVHHEPHVASVKTVAHEPTVSEYSTYTASAPSFTKTDVHPQPDLVHDSYTPGFVHKSVEAVPVVHHQPHVASVKTVAHEPTVSEYSTYTAAAPSFTKTDVHPQPDLVHDSYTPGFEHKTLEAAPTVSEYSSYAAAAPKYESTPYEAAPSYGNYGTPQNW